MKPVVIAGYVRTPFHFAHKGDLARIRPDDLAATAVRALISRTGIAPEDIEDLITGCAFPEGEQGLNIARMLTYLSGLPLSVAGTTVNRFCGSSMQAVHQAAGAIQMKAGEAFLCVGVESMTRVPLRGFNPLPHPGLAETYPQAFTSMGMTAENLARAYGISRAEQDDFAADSHAKAAAADFTDEIAAIGNVTRDGCIRPGTTADSLASLKPAFAEGGSVTAGASSPLTDGAAAVLVTSQEYAERHKLPMLARLRSIAVSGCAPDIMGIGPVQATRKALTRAGLTVQDLDIIELNEAFAAQAIACIRDLDLPIDRINLDGGAIALGHPLGATGARITGKAASLLHQRGGHYALATQCIGGGQGIATILEAVT